MTENTAPALTADEDAALLYFGADAVHNPFAEIPAVKVCRSLARKGLAERTRNGWSLTDAGRAHVAASIARDAAPVAETVAATPIAATPAETIELLEQVAAEQDRAVAMLDAMLTAPGRSPESIAYVARAALRLLADDNGPLSVSGLALAELDRRHPAQCVTVDGEPGTGLRWHLVDRDGNPVEAGEYTAKWSGRPRFTIAEHPEIQGWTSIGVPICVWVEWVDVTRGYCEPGELVDGWNWAAERV